MSSQEFQTDWRGPRYRTSTGWRNALMVVTAQFAEVTRAGAPLCRGLLVIASEATDPRLRESLLVLNKDLSAGKSLHEALARQSDFFPAYYVDLIKNGEKTGRLDQALADIEQVLVETATLRDKARNYALYVGLVLFIELFLAIQLSFFVVPQFASIFGGFGHDLPLSTQMIVKFGHAVPRWEGLVTMVFLLMAGIVLWRNMPYLSRRQTRFSNFLSAVFLWLPFLRGMLIKHDAAYIAGILNKLVAAGTPMNEALEDLAALDANPAFRRALLRMKQKVEHGLSLHEAINSQGRLFPESFRGLLALGDDRGLLAQTLAETAALYRREALSSAHILLDLMALAGVCLVGSIVFLVYSGVFSAIFQLPLLVQQ